MRKAFLLLSVFCAACLWGGQPAGAQAPQYYQYQGQPQYQQVQPQYQGQPQYHQGQPQYQQYQGQPQYRPGTPGAQPPGTAYPGAPPYAGTAPYAPPRGPSGPGGRPTRGGGVSALTVGECSNLGCSVREDSSCPAIVHDYHTRHWACQCGGGSSCVNQSSPY